MVIQGTGHALKIQAADLGNILTRLTEMLMILQQGIRPSIIILKALEFLAESETKQGVTVGECAALLPCC